MKNYIIIGLLGLLSVITGCDGQTDAKKDTATAGKNHKIVKQYTCTMHPDILKDKPGICPKCGMDLVEKGKDN